MNTTIFIAHLHMYLFSTIFCTFFFTSFLFFEGTFSSPYIKGKQNKTVASLTLIFNTIVPGKGGWEGLERWGSIAVFWAFPKIPYNVYTY